MRPLIGIPCRELQAKGKDEPILGVLIPYVTSVEIAGGLPILIPLCTDENELRQFFDLSHGILLTGGEDVNPQKYNETPIPELKRTSDSRDRIEMEIAKWAVESKKPILAICRGIQVLNVALGGTLYQDIASQTKSSIQHDLHGVRSDEKIAGHSVNLIKETALSKILGETGSVHVNSLHHQSIKEVGRGIKVSAKSEDGIIEGVESEDSSCFCLGVQWHPEIMWQKGDVGSQKLFEALIEASKKNYKIK